MKRYFVTNEKEAVELQIKFPAARVGSGYTFIEAWNLKIASQMSFYICPQNPKIWVWDTKKPTHEKKNHNKNNPNHYNNMVRD